MEVAILVHLKEASLESITFLLFDFRLFHTNTSDINNLQFYTNTFKLKEVLFFSGKATEISPVHHFMEREQ